VELLDERDKMRERADEAVQEHAEAEVLGMMRSSARA
jgi:hypothetical protein